MDAGEDGALGPCSASAPAAVQPEPLFGMLPDPAFDHAGHDLHRALHVDLTGGVAHRIDLLDHLESEAVAGQANDAYAMDRALDPGSKPGQQRIALRLAPEKGDVDTLDVILVDQHAGV